MSDENKNETNDTETSESGGAANPAVPVKREIEYHAPVREFDNTKHIITNVGFTAKADEKYQIIWLIPETDEESLKRYDAPLSALIEAGVRQLSTRPDYKTIGFEDDGTPKLDGHQGMQDLADGYQVGKRVVGVGQKVMAQKAVAAEKELGMSMEEMVAKMLAMKADGLLTD